MTTMNSGLVLCRRSCFFLALIISFTCLISSTQSWGDLQESSNRECAICHVMWLNEFKQKDLTPLIPFDPQPVTEFGKQDVVSTQRMCVSCHDGFVLDSRDMWKEGRHNHPVGQQPSEHITIPTSKGKEIFPLNKEGRIYCGTCHSAHGTDWNKEQQSVFLRMSNVNSRMCMACHFNLSTGLKDGNHPVHKLVKEIPNNLVEAGSLFSNKDGVICQSCHRPHGARGDPLLVLDNKKSELCGSCHQDPARIVNSKHDLSRSAPEAKNLNDSIVAESGPCSACHIPHYARGPRLWARSVAPGPDFLSSTCTSCHDERGIAKDKVVGKHSHPVGIPISAIGIRVQDNHWSSKEGLPASIGSSMQALPLFDKNGAVTKNGGYVTCLTCHNPHQWKPGINAPLDAERELEEPTLEEGDGGSSFLRMANDDSQLCMNCHVEQAVVKYSKHNLNHKTLDTPDAEGMSVSQSGTCSACHLPHNGNGIGMWARQLSDGYTGVEKRCASCHQENGVASEHLTGEYSHPLHRELGDIGDESELPLYTEQGLQQGGKLIDCTTCHNPHRWDPNNINSEFQDIEGDASNSFLRERASHKSQLCQECHTDQGIVEGTDHDLAFSAPDRINSKQQTVDQTGLCGQCHAIHNATLPNRLGFAELDYDQPVMEKLCTGCHNEEGVAHTKVPDELSHPDRNVPVNSSRQREGASKWDEHPVFDEQGQSAGLGKITCVTCHNPHQWDPANPAKGSGVNIEGDVMSSFLRVSATDNFLCSDCHGRDSLYRYKYFHWQKSRAQERSRKPE